MLDIEDNVRRIDIPAIQPGPLYRLMFPSWAEAIEHQQNEIVKRYAEARRVEGCPETANRQFVNFLQICAADVTSLGFCGWAMEQRWPAAMKPSTVQHIQSRRLVPEALDLYAWLSVSRVLKKERERVLIRLYELCRKSVPQDKL
jgi:hypothetical protein